jgi:ribosomal protein S18 acetylase RimI-like enzyme
VPPEWSLRPATNADREFLFDLHRGAYREAVDALWGWNDEEQERRFDERFELERPQVIKVGAEDVGELRIEARADGFNLASLVLAPAWQGQGIGSSILDGLLGRAAAERKRVTLRVLVTNPRARRLYERKGFRVTSTTKTHVYMRAEP